MGKAGPVALVGVGDERELADDEDRAARVQDAAVELAFRVLEDAQAGGTAGEPAGLFLGVVLGDAEENAEAGADLADDVTVRDDTCGRDPLDDGPQRYAASRASSAWRYSLLCGRKMVAMR